MTEPKTPGDNSDFGGFIYVLFTEELFVFSLFSPQAFFFTGSVVLSYAAAFIVSVCVEFPMIQLEKLIFKTKR